MKLSIVFHTLVEFIRFYKHEVVPGDAKQFFYGELFLRSKKKGCCKMQQPFFLVRIDFILLVFSRPQFLHFQHGLS